MNKINPRALALYGASFLAGYLIFGTIKMGLWFLLGGLLLSILV